MNLKPLALLGSLAFALMASVAPASAAPIYRLGGECPTDTDMSATTVPEYTRQYQVTGALACVYDPVGDNIGDGNAADKQAEANFYLGLGWTNLGQEVPGGTVMAGTDIPGFTFTLTPGTNDGTFSILPSLTSTYNQFALGIKDGGIPQWAIFLLPQGMYSSNWFINTQQGELSHFVLYARNNTGNPCPEFPCTINPLTPVPDGGTTAALLGFVLVGFGVMRRKFSI